MRIFQNDINMKIKKLLIFAVLAVSAASTVNAAFIASSSLFELDGTGSDTIILGHNAPNDPLLSGIASSGTFSITDAAVDALVATSSYQSLVAAFGTGTLIGTSDFTDDASDYYGLTVSGVYAFDSGLGFNETPIIGTTLYTFIGNDSTLADSIAFALYRHSTTLAADPLIGPETNYNLVLTGGSLLIGNLGTKSLDIPDLAGVASYRTITLVPEPSAALLGSLGVLVLLRRRRN
jgi:hypothetical protein